MSVVGADRGGWACRGVRVGGRPARRPAWVSARVRVRREAAIVLGVFRLRPVPPGAPVRERDCR